VPHPTKKSGFTLIEIILVVVISMILMGITLPHFARTYKGAKLRIAARTLTRMGNYARGMAILRNTTITIVMNPETSEIYLGQAQTNQADQADGELDQSVLKRLGYVDGSAQEDPGIEREVQRHLPEGIEIKSFEKDLSDEEDFGNLYLVHYYSDGQSDGFTMELQDQQGLRVELENDPISGKLRSEFLQ
jgi:prepilin-type N-terminal cleavage/methylation domain-containing protein